MWSENPGDCGGLRAGGTASRNAEICSRGKSAPFGLCPGICFQVELAVDDHLSNSSWVVILLQELTPNLIYEIQRSLASSASLKILLIPPPLRFRMAAFFGRTQPNNSRGLVAGKTDRTPGALVRIRRRYRPKCPTRLICPQALMTLAPRTASPTLPTAPRRTPG